MPKPENHKSENHKWTFAARFRRGAFGWRSQPAIKRVKEAVSEIRKSARKQPLLAAEGAVLLLEKLSPALEQVDSSSGAIGTAVNNAIGKLVPIIAAAPAADELREAWLERLWEAHQADQIPYIESLAEHWGELCASKEQACAWADRLLGITRMALNPDRSIGGHFHGTSACLSALFHSERYAEVVELLEVDTIWPYKRWAVRALAAMGRKAEAVRYAQSCRSPWATDTDIDSLCEEVLLSSGLIDEAYARYGLTANRAGTYLAWFRAVAKKYPKKPAAEVLADLAGTTPGDEGKWFAAAKDAGLFDEALALATRSPCDPRTLTRAARDYADEEPAFAVGAGLLALHWLVQGHGYEITVADVQAAYSHTLKAAEHAGAAAATQEEIRRLVATEKTADRFVSRALGRDLGLE
jgi:hypothetical protein